MDATRLIAVRHGETAWNVGTRIQGQLDIGLNATGLWQARQAARALADEPVAAIYASDLSRALQTALEIAQPHGVEVQVDRALRERAFGHFKAALSPRSIPCCRWKPVSGAPAIRFRARRRRVLLAFGIG